MSEGLRFDFHDFNSGEDRIKGVSPWEKDLLVKNETIVFETDLVL